jgi:predicted glycogen debranching enzyme
MTNDLAKMKDDEWLEADGLGGFACGTVSGIRTRRYHALLLAATNPPSGRVALVNGFDAWVETEGGTFSLSSQLYNPDVMYPDGARRIEQFRADPWPQWIYALEDETKIQFELFSCSGASVRVLRWRLLTSKSKSILAFRPFLSGRDYHSMHHENGAFQFELRSGVTGLSGIPTPVSPQSSCFPTVHTAISPTGTGTFSTSRSAPAG